MSDKNTNASSRRTFLKTSTVAAASAGIASQLLTPIGAYAAGEEKLKIGLVGCGGRGSKAAVQALSTAGNVELTAMADMFRDQLDGSLQRIERAVSGDDSATVSVDEEHKFVGFDAYKQVIDSDIDVLVTATPPGFRPMIFEYAIQAGKHVFMEKPVATDPAGVKRVLDAAKVAKEKGLRVGVGLQRHHQSKYREIIQRIHDGAIGDVLAMRVYWNGGGVWEPRASRDEVATEMEYQLRNWYYYNWLCGDHICEQHIHNLDIGNWVKQSFPVSANGMGGREVRTDKRYGEIYDHHAVEFTYADGTKMFSQCRHIPNCWNSVTEHAHGTKGYSDISGGIIENADGRYRDRSKDDPYQVEHDDLFTAIRQGTEYSEAEYGAMSTMTSILGRLATYSGKEVKMEDALNSGVSIMPEKFAMDADPPTLPDENGVYPVPVPGVFKPYQA